MKIEIRDRSKVVLFSVEADSVKHAVVEAVLRGANLRGANLRGANLRGANLRGADLHDADLHDADLHDADLCDADLHDANLHDADLHRADLCGADLCGADLCGADLRGADLRGADLCGADLQTVRSDFLSEVLKLPNELEFLQSALVEGRVDGSTYSGECACLAGTMAHAKGIVGYSGGDITNGCTFHGDSSSPRERFFLAIRKGHTPENNSVSKIALEWTEEAIRIRDNIRSTQTVSAPLLHPEDLKE